MSRVSIPYMHEAVDVVTQSGRTRLSRVQRFEVNSNFPNTPVNELGSDRRVGRIFDIPEVTATLSIMDVGVRSAFTMAGLDFSTVPTGYSVGINDFGYVTLVQPFKAQAGNDIVRTLVVPGAKVESIALNYSVGGDATEDYTFNASTRHYLRYDAVAVSGVVASGGVFTIPGGNARQLRNGRYFICVFGPNGYIPDNAVTSSSATTVTFNTSLVPVNTPVVVLVHRDETDQWRYTYEVTPSTEPIGVRGWGVELYLVQSGQSNRRVFRAQSCTLNIAYNSEPVNELGSEYRVGYNVKVPDVTGTIEIMKHDFRLPELLSGDNNDSSPREHWDVNELSGGGWGLEIRVYRRGVDRSTTAPEKTIWVPEIEITSEVNSSNVDQDSMYSFDWASRTSQVYFYRGARP
jgi:hypothetical protein